MMNNGKFVVSLDFELFWGIRDLHDLDSSKKYLHGVWEIMPRMLDVFDKYGVKGTFATVGFLFASNKKQLLRFTPTLKPSYDDSNLSPYNGHFDLLGETEEEDKFHYASGLLDLINEYPEQEISTHTFSHYYCLEKGQTLEQFRADIESAVAIAAEKNIEIKSLIFPRNQFNNDYLNVIKDLGLTSYRGNEKSWFYSASKHEQQNLLRRAMRMIDTYVNISGNNCTKISEIKSTFPYNIPSSRFLRPYSPKLRFFESLRLNRIKKGMEYAAKNGEVYHLWWHPHNFSDYQNENIEFLTKIFQYYSTLERKYGFESITMTNLANELKTE